MLYIFKMWIPCYIDVNPHFSQKILNKAKKKINKCFSGHFFEKQMRQAGFFFISQKTDEATFFYFLFDQNTMRLLFFVHFKHKNADILILTFEKNE